MPIKKVVEYEDAADAAITQLVEEYSFPKDKVFEILQACLRNVCRRRGFKTDCNLEGKQHESVQ